METGSEKRDKEETRSTIEIEKSGGRGEGKREKRWRERVANIIRGGNGNFLVDGDESN